MVAIQNEFSPEDVLRAQEYFRLDCRASASANSSRVMRPRRYASDFRKVKETAMPASCGETVRAFVTYHPGTE